jgi:transcriptional regulator with XRE-family HTH domain
MPRTLQPKFVAFGDRLRTTREALGVGVPALARRTGIGQNTIYHYEAGIRAPNAVGEDSDGAKLCEALGIDMDWLYRADTRGLTMQLTETLRLHLEQLNATYVIETMPKLHKRRPR